MTDRDKDSSDDILPEKGETAKTNLPSPSPDRLKASLANLRKKHTGMKLPSPGSGLSGGESRFRIPSPEGGSSTGLDDESEPDLGTDRIAAEDLEALSLSEVSFVTEDSEADDEEARTEMISGDLAAQFSFEDADDARPAPGLDPRVLAPLQLPRDEDDHEEDRTQIVSGDALDFLDGPPGGLNSGLDAETIAEIDDDEGADRTEMISRDQLAFLDDQPFGAEKTQLAESPFDFSAGKPGGSSPLHPGPTGAEGLAESTQPEVEALSPTPEARPNPAFRSGPATPVADDDFHAEKTELYDSPFENEPIFPKLTVLEGPTAGQEFLVNRMRNTIGRGTNNTIVVADLAMSRQHFEIQQNPDESYILRDLNSVNGTQLNGTRVKEADLLHGDRVEAGKTIFQFVIPGTAPQPTRQRRVVPAGLTSTVTGEPALRPARAPEPASRQGLQKALVYTTLAAVVFSVVLTAAILFVSTGSSSSAASDGLTASQVYMQGVEAVQARDWQQAEAYFRRTLELEPQFESVAAQLSRISAERAVLATIEEARGAVDGEPSENLLTRLEGIGQESVYVDEAGQLLRQLRNRRIYATFEKAQALARAGELDKAGQALEELLDAQPRHEGALALKAEIERRIEEASAPEPAPVAAVPAEEVQDPRQAVASRIEEPPRTERTPTPAPSRPRTTTASDDDDWTIEPVGRPKTTKTKTSSGPAPVVNFTEGFRLYQARNFKGASDHFQSIADGSDGALAQRAGRLASDVRRFERAFNSANEAMNARRYSQAVRHLDDAKRMDASIAGNNSAFQRVISNQLATAHGELGLAALGEGDVDRAKNHHRQGRTNNSSDAAVQRLGRELEGR